MANESKEQYIQILPPYSIDLHWDAGEPERPNGSFQVLKNYVPENDILRTRKGITIFTYTPSVTAPATYNPLTDTATIMWTRYETSGTLMDDEIQGANFWEVTAGNTLSASGSFKQEGVASMYGDYYTLPGAGLNQGMWVDGTSLQTINFPGFVPGKHSFIMCFWYRPTFRDEKTLYFSRNDNTQKGAWLLTIVTAAGATYKFQAQIINSAGALRTVTSDTSMFAGTWYHLALWSSIACSASGLIIKVGTAGGVTSIVTTPPIVMAGTYTSGTSFRMTMNPTFRSGRGYIDDFIVTTDNLSSESAYITRVAQIRDRS